ncbi:16S rRNA (uracil(1498)-N(3))-methyltransferase [Phytoactinopolyspora mesophila]|uniref:16S rRNA (uracil(1498)-N(3))-methyltransferase n=1 Tax=Phytoactinopolyspora mesophila TaxID=2650750 RepID=UPI001C9E4733
MFHTDPVTLRASDAVVLAGDEGRHAAVVRRIRPGERVDLTDGAGHLARCVVVGADRNGLTCDVQDRVDVAEPAPRLVVLQALPKGERGETAVETMTEVGVDEIVPWSASRCMVRWKGERGEKALRKWRSTAREAAKQSRRAWFPKVADPAATPAAADRLATATRGLVLHEEAETALGDVELPAHGEIVMVVGPEGGVAPEELEAFRAVGAEPVRLGPTVLRTSTAGTVAAGIILSRTARWNP